MTTFKKEDEVILVASREALFENESLTFQGLNNDSESVDKIMENVDRFFRTMRRGSREEGLVDGVENAELAMNFKQPIPYIVIRKQFQGEQFFYVTQRLSGGGEARLHGKLAMGAGGHMNPLEKNIYPFKKVLEVNTMRELEEELEINGKVSIKTLGLINDDSDEVGQVHLGILGVIDLEFTDSVFVKETEQLSGSWLSLEELKSKEVYEKLENWGKIVVDMM